MSVINGVLNSLHVKLGWTSPPPPLLFFSLPPLSLSPGFITQLIRQMHDRYRVPKAGNCCYRRLITLQISYLNLASSHSVDPLVRQSPPRSDRTNAAIMFVRSMWRAYRATSGMDDRYPQSIIDMHAENIPVLVENILMAGSLVNPKLILPL